MAQGDCSKKEAGGTKPEALLFSIDSGTALLTIAEVPKVGGKNRLS
jgi:hypothetical protein